MRFAEVVETFSSAPQTEFRVRAIDLARNEQVSLAEQIAGTTGEITLTAAMTPMKAYINEAGRAMRLEIRGSSANWVFSTFTHSVNLVRWEPTP